MDADQRHLREFCEEAGIKLMVLFGSRSEERNRPGSDVDIAILLEALPTPGRRFHLEDAIRQALGVSGDIDMVILNALESSTLAREIARTGRPLVDRDGDQWPEFVSLATRRYADFEPFRRLRKAVLGKEDLG